MFLNVLEFDIQLFVWTLDETLILLYYPGRGLNSRPPAHRSFKHGQGAIQVLRNVFFWKLDPHPPPHNANDV